MQHQPGMGFKTLKKFLNPSPGRTIEFCDSPYHILATNVNTELRGLRGRLAGAVGTGSLPTLFPGETHERSNLFLAALVGIMDACDLGHDQDEPAGDLPFPQQI
jgi:hypothetical protein